MIGMTLSKVKILAVTMLAFGLSLVSLDTFGQSGGLGGAGPSDVAAVQVPLKGGSPDLPRTLDKIQADVKEAMRENARLQEALRTTEGQLEAIRAGIQDQPAGQNQDVGKEAAEQLLGAMKDGSSRAVDRLVEALGRYPVTRTPNDSNGTQLYLMDLASGKAMLIADRPSPGFDSCGSPRWSRDGRRIAFDATISTELQRARIKTLEVRDGRPTIADLGPGNCPSFSPDGEQVAFLINPGAEGNPQPGVWIMWGDGSERRQLTTEFGAPNWSPTGQGFLIKGFGQPSTNTMFRLEDVTSGVMAVPGHEIFSWPSWVDSGTVVASIRAQDGAESIALLDVRQPRQSKVVEVLWKRNASLDLKPFSPVYHRDKRRCYFVGVEEGKRTLIAIDPAHPDQPVRLEGRGFDDRLGGLTFSPDGRYLLYAADRPPMASNP
ncbi:hypothetical protein EP7_005558 (plasmid) [Isosphaeraceae bacterium EP7]